MGDFNLEIKGLDELRDAVRKFPAECKRELVKANRKIGATIVRNTIPVTPGPGLSKSTTGYAPTGALRRSIKYETNGWRGVKVKAGGPGVNYALYVHEGLGRHRKWGPRPFLTTGVEMSKEKIKKIIQKAVDICVKDIPGRKTSSVVRRMGNFFIRFVRR